MPDSIYILATIQLHRIQETTFHSVYYYNTLYQFCSLLCHILRAYICLTAAEWTNQENKVSS